MKGSLIAACLVLGTLLAWHLGEGRFSTAHAATPATVTQTKPPPSAPATTAPTVTAYEPTVMIPLRSSIQANQLKAVQVSETMGGLVQNAGDFAGKTAVTTLLPGDLIYKEGKRWTGIFRTWVRGAVIDRDFDPNSWTRWFDTSYTNNGYAYSTRSVPGKPRWC